MGRKLGPTVSFVEMGNAQRNDSSLLRERNGSDDLPVGNQKRGRKPKGPSPFTKNFVRLLAEKGCTHRQAAKIAGVSPSVISGWTAGSTPNDPAALLKITEALGADFQFVLTGTPAGTVPKQRLDELFDIEEEMSGIFQLDLRRLRLRK